MTDIERLARAAGVEALEGVYDPRVGRLSRMYSTESVAAIVAQARREALEEAARVCNRFGERHMHPHECAAAIRAMKD